MKPGTAALQRRPRNGGKCFRGTGQSQVRDELVGRRGRLPPGPGNPSLTPHVNEHHYRPTAAVALILSQDPLAAALLGAAVELIGCSIAFAAPDESAPQAFRRLRPAFLLIDASDKDICASELLGPALMTGTPAILFGSAAAVSIRRHFAKQFQLEPLVMPRDFSRLSELLGPAGRKREPAR